jgi:lysyl endopeptidase
MIFSICKLRRLLSIIFYLFCICAMKAQSIDTIGIPTIEINKTTVNNAKNSNKRLGGPLKISELIDTVISVRDLGRMSKADGRFSFVLRVLSKDATGISLSLGSFNLNEKDEIRIYNSYGDQIQFLNQELLSNRKYHINTTKVSGEEIIIDFSTFDTTNHIPFVVNRINHFLVPIRKKESGPPNRFQVSGPCQVDVNCIEGSDWKKEVNSVVLLWVDDYQFCSAAVINNTNEDGKPYLLTANHCFDDPNLSEGPSSAAANTDVVFNYESPWCNGPDVPFSDVLSGATIKARYVASDMVLLELNQDIPTEFYTYYSGWDILNTQPPDGVGIHHPRGDVKKIATFDNNPLTSAGCMNYYEGSPPMWLADSFYWEINSWEKTVNGHSVTERGSSGSPLYNSNKRIIGQLYGPGYCPDPNCSNPYNDIANYGKTYSSWTGGGSPNNRLRDWLDP